MRKVVKVDDVQRLQVKEKKLLARFQAGDASAFDEIVKLYHARLLTAARMIIQSDCDAEEVVQDSWLRAYRGLHRFRQNSRLSTWLYSIVINQSCTFRRRHSSGDEPIPAGADLVLDRILEGTGGLFCRNSDDQPQTELLQREYYQLLVEEIKKLPPPLSKTMYMHYIGDLSYQEIADAFSCPIGTVKSRISRGRRRLIRKIRKY